MVIEIILLYIAHQIIEMKSVFYYCFLALLLGCQSTGAKKESVKLEIDTKHEVKFVDLSGREVS